MPIAEPMTMATDYLLAGVAGVLAFRLACAARRVGARSIGLWAAALAATSLAALVGGSYHGLALVLEPTTLHGMWRVTVLVIGVSSALTLSGTLYATLAPRLRGAALAAVGVKLAAFAVLSSLRRDFVVAVADYVVAMLAILALEYAFASDPPARRRFFLFGLVVSFGAALLQQARIGFGPGFNHNDLYHVIQTGALYLLYRGALLLRDRTT